MSRIEEIIEEMQDYLDDCKYSPLSKTTIQVNKEDMEGFLEDLQNTTPEEIRRYQKIIANKDAIMEDAQEKADNMIAQTQLKVNEMVSEHEIMRQASAQATEVVSIATNQAQEIMDQATEDANNIRTAAIEYVDSLLRNVQAIVVLGIDQSRTHYEGLQSSLQECLNLVEANRAELAPQEEAPAAAETTEEGEDGYSIL